MNIIESQFYIFRQKKEQGMLKIYDKIHKKSERFQSMKKFGKLFDLIEFHFSIR